MTAAGSSGADAPRSATPWLGSIKGRVVLPADDGYDTARRVWNLEADRHPAAIVLPADADDVARAVGIARARDLRIAVRSGGHSQAGHGTVDGGVVIDLQSIAGVDIDRSADTVRAGGGIRVGQLLDRLRPAGLVVPTGECRDVGLGGLTLGGGESPLTAKLGAVCDSLLSAQVVIADGRVVTASAEENADLFWAIRGGGGNFGIVTRFTFRAYRFDRVLAGRFLFPVTRTREVVLRYRELIEKAPDELQTSAGIVPSEGEPALFVAVCYCGEFEDGNRLIDQWHTALAPQQNDIVWAPYFADMVLPSIPSQGTGAFLPHLNDDVIEVFADYFPAAPPSCTAAWNDHHGAITRVPVDAMAFPLRQRGYGLFMHAGWKQPELRHPALAWLAGLSRELARHSSGVYVNSLGDEPPGRTVEAYGPNYARLRTIKSKYDPDNVFRVNHNVVPG
jgi:FAD/FMN-containing dehydrogenase